MAKKSVAKKRGATGAASKKAGGKKKATKRELIDTGNDKRFVRRNDQGQFDEVEDVGRSLTQDRRRKAKTVAKPGQGDKGDRASSKKSATKTAAVKKTAAKKATAKKTSAKGRSGGGASAKRTTAKK